MKKYFNFFFITLILVVFLTACGKDTEVVADGQLVTLCDLKGSLSKYKGKYVRIDNVQFIADDVGKFFGGSYVGQNLTNPNGVATRLFQDCAGNSFTVYTDVLSSFVGSIVPSGSGTLRGVISIGPTGQPQLNITKESDFSSMTNARCNIVPTVCATTLETIANIRNLGIGSVIGSVRVRGVVISDWTANNVTGASTQRQNFVIQDATGGMTFRLSAATSGSSPFPFAMGETVEVNLLGKLVAQFNDQMQIGSIDISDVNDLGTGVDPMPTPQVITITELNSDAFESQLIQINGVTFGAGTYSGNQNFTVGALTGVCRTNTAATFSNIPLRTTVVNIKGIGGRNGASRQIQPRNTSDLP